MQAVLSSVISSCVLIMRALLHQLLAVDDLDARAPGARTAPRGSTASTPTGSASRPRCSSSTRIFSATSSARPDSGDIAPRIVEMPARERPVAEPRVVELVVAGGRAEVPHDRLVALGQQAEAVELVLRPRADVRRRDVADVGHVEAEQRAQLRLRQQLAIRARRSSRSRSKRTRSSQSTPISAIGVQCHRALAPQRSRRAARPACNRLRLPADATPLTCRGTVARVCKRLQDRGATEPGEWPRWG